jgi:hypothetical protein
MHSRLLSQPLLSAPIGNSFSSPLRDDCDEEEQSVALEQWLVSPYAPDARSHKSNQDLGGGVTFHSSIEQNSGRPACHGQPRESGSLSMHAVFISSFCKERF